MANKLQLWTQLRKAVKILDELWKSGTTNTPNTLDLITNLQGDYLGDHVSYTAQSFVSLRAGLSSLVSSSSCLLYILTELAKVGYNSRSTNLQIALAEIIKGMNVASETISSRAYVHGARVAGGSNVGNGILYRLIMSQYAALIEAGRPGVVKGEVQTDKNTGQTSGTEQMLLFGSGQVPVDNLDLGDVPGTSITISATRPDDPAILRNPSFEIHSGTGGVDIDYDGWSISDATKISNDTTTTFREDQALEFLEDATVTQWLAANGQINPELPTFLIVRYYRKANCDGTLTINLGSKTASIVLATVANATWFDLYIGIDDIKGWYTEWLEDDSDSGARIKVALSGRTTGTLLIDEIILAQPTKYNGLYYLLTAGQEDFLKEDYFTFTDTCVETGRIQFTLSRLFGTSFPHTSGVPTYADA